MFSAFLFLYFCYAGAIWHLAVFWIYFFLPIKKKKKVGYQYCHYDWVIYSKCLICLMWCIWKERNSRCFEDFERAMPDLKFLFIRTLLEWFSVWRNHPFFILDLLDFCNFRSWLVHPCILLVCLGVSFFIIYEFLLLIKKKKMFNL